MHHHSWAHRMFEWVKALATKIGDPSVITRAHRMEGENGNCKLSSDLCLNRCRKQE